MQKKEFIILHIGVDTTKNPQASERFAGFTVIFFKTTYVLVVIGGLEPPTPAL